MTAAAKSLSCLDHVHPAGNKRRTSADGLAFCSVDIPAGIPSGGGLPPHRARPERRRTGNTAVIFFAAAGHPLKSGISGCRRPFYNTKAHRAMPRPLLFTRHSKKGQTGKREKWEFLGITSSGLVNQDASLMKSLAALSNEAKTPASPVLHFFISAAPSFLHEPPMGASSLKNQISKVQKKREMGVFFLTSADSVNEDVSLMKAFAALSNEVARFAR